MRVHLNIGSNLGDRKENITRAIELISGLEIENIRVSDFMESAPWGFDSENVFINAGVSFDTAISPIDLLEALQGIESEISGGNPHRNADGTYRDRVLDIDIILYGDARLNLPGLVIPHPRAARRDFVINPLRQIDPQLLPILEAHGSNAPVAASLT